MILIPEQISKLRRQIVDAKEKFSHYKDYLDSKDIDSGDYGFTTLVGDASLDFQYSRERKAYADAMFALENAIYKKDVNTDVIDIGTKFTIQFDGDEEQGEFILVEGAEGLSFKDRFVSLNSPLGQNAIGKRENENFEYIVTTGISLKDKYVVKGKIVAINKEPNSYTKFICEKDKCKRIGKNYKNRYQELLTSSTDEVEKEWEGYQTISPSQRLILLIEADRLSRRINEHSAANRLAIVKQLLKEAKVAKPPTDGSIGIGSNFEIKVNRDGKVETIQAEMINQAISEELDCDYIERTSPLGYQIYGLHEGDTFTFKEGRKVYNGYVSAVTKSKDEEDTLGFQYYK